MYICAVVRRCVFYVDLPSW